MLEWIKSKYKVFAVIFCVILAVIIGLIIFFNIPRLTYEYNDEYGGYIVSKAYGNSESYVIPETHKGKPVVGVGTRAFFRHDKLEEVEFKDPTNIKYIGKLSFSECPELESIDISYAVEIERNAFSYDKSLASISIGAKNIGASAFYKCESLENVELLEGVETIGSMAFSHTAIEEIELPNSIDIIYVDCFIYAEALSSIIVDIDKKNDVSFMNENYYLLSLGDVVSFV